MPDPCGAGRTGSIGNDRTDLVESTNRDRGGGRVVIKPLPARAARPRTGRPRVVPDGAVVVTLINMRAAGGDLHRGRIVIQLLPSRTTCWAARGARIKPD